MIHNSPFVSPRKMYFNALSVKDTKICCEAEHIKILPSIIFVKQL